MSLLTAAAGAVGYFEVWPKYVCRQWETQAATAPDAEAEIAVARLEGCGPLGTIALTRLLASDRPYVAEAAHARLAAICHGIRDAAGNDPDGFTIDPADMVTLEALAEGMEELAHNHPREVPDPVADFAWDVLEMTGRMKLQERVPLMARGRLTTISDQLLQRPTKQRPEAPKITKPTPTKTAPADDAATLHRLEAQRTLASLYALPVATGTAGSSNAPGGLPTAMPATPLAAVAPPQSMSSGVPSVVVTELQGSGADAADSQSTANAAARINPIRDGADPSVIRQVSTAPGGVDLDMAQNAGANTAATANAALQRHLTTRTAWALLGDLQAAGSPQASAAAAELHRRGFSLREIELGKHLTSPDAAERARYLETLPSAGIAVKPWLLYLSSDPDAEVRRAAVAIMATSNDPELKAKLRELAITDADEAVREQAGKSGRPAKMRMPAGY